MAKKTTDPVERARIKMARAQDRYVKAVAKGERMVRQVRERADKRIAIAKVELEVRAQQLAAVEMRTASGPTPLLPAGPELSSDHVGSDDGMALDGQSAEPLVVLGDSSPDAQPKPRTVRHRKPPATSGSEE